MGHDGISRPRGLTAPRTIHCAERRLSDRGCISVNPIEDAEDIAAALPANLVTFERIAAGRHGMFIEEPR